MGFIDLRTAAQQALKALEGGGETWRLVGPAIDALKAALAEPNRAQQMRDAGYTRRPTLREMAEPVEAEYDPENDPPARKASDWAPPKDYGVDGSVAAMAALAEQVQEPYCYVYEYDSPHGLHREFYPREYNGMKPTRTMPLYTAPPQRKPLTEEEIEVLQAKYAPPVHPDFSETDDWMAFARAIERAHGIGGEA